LIPNLKTEVRAEFAGVFTELRAVGWHRPIFSPGWHGPKISPQAHAWAECQARGPCWHGPQTRRAVPAREVAGRAWPVPGPERAGSARWPYIALSSPVAEMPKHDAGKKVKGKSYTTVTTPSLKRRK